jgi:hypothetical protein
MGNRLESLKKPFIPPKKAAFEVDKTIRVKLHIDLAIDLGSFILEKGSPNPALMALGHQLKKLEAEEFEEE